MASPLRAGEDVEIWDEGANNWNGSTLSDGDPIDTNAAQTAYRARLTVDRKGRVYVGYVQSDGTRDHLYASRYDGAEVKIWDNGSLAWTDSFTNGDPVDTTNARTVINHNLQNGFTTDSKDNAYFAFNQADGTKNRLYLTRWDGTSIKIWDADAPGWTETLTSGDPLDINATGEAANVRFVVDSQDRVYINYVQSVSGTYRVMLNRYDGSNVTVWDNGTSAWTTTYSNGDPVDRGSFSGAGNVSICVDSSDKVYLAWSQINGSTTRTHLTRFDGTDVKIWDNGSSDWTDTFSNGDPVDRTTTASGNPNVAADSNGFVYVTYHQSDGTADRVYLSRYDGTDVKIWDHDGAAWTDTFSSGDPIDTAQVQAIYPHIAVDSADRVYVAFGQSDGTRRRLFLSRYDGSNVAVWDNGASSWTTTLASGDPIDSGPNAVLASADWGDIRIDSQDRVYIAYTQSDGTRNRVYLTRYDGSDIKIWDHGASGWTDTFSNGDPIDTTAAQTASHARLAVDAADRVYVSFQQTDGTKEHIYLARYRPAEATTYDARVSVFRQGASTDRTVGSLVGVWSFSGATFSSQNAAGWMRDRPGSASSVFKTALVKDDPTYAFAALEGSNGFLRWAGTTWTRDQVSVGNAYTHALAAVASNFAVFCPEDTVLYRWTGTTWLVENVGGSSWYDHFSFVSTSFGLAGGGEEEFHLIRWTGTTWRRDMQQAFNNVGAIAAVASDYAWYWRSVQGSAIEPFLWRGTSWTRQSTLPTSSSPAYLGAIPGERGFAVGAESGGRIWRWTGTSWFQDWSGPESWVSGAVVATDWAWMVGGSGALVGWRGTSWVRHGPLTSSTLTVIDAWGTDWAIAGGAAGALWVWRGTSWINESLPESDQVTSVSTVGETLSLVTVSAGQLYRRQRVNLIDDSIAVYRTVVQVTPRGAMWTWAGTSDTQSYFSLLDDGQGTTDFISEGGGGGTGPFYVSRGNQGDADYDDVLIWVDTVGGWDGFSPTHNASSATGHGLTESGGVDTNPSGNDVWGEKDNRIGRQLGGGEIGLPVADNWTTVSGGTGAGSGTVIREDALTWEFWQYGVTTATEGRTYPVGLHVAAGPFGTELAGLRWSVRKGNCRPRTGAWRWCRDNATAAQVMKEPGARLDDVAPTDDYLQLRIRVDETDGGYQYASGGDWTLFFSTDRSSWTQMSSGSSQWRLLNGLGIGNSTLPAATLPGVTKLGKLVESWTSAPVAIEGFDRMEVGFSVTPVSATAGTTYYFEARHAGRRCLPKPGVEYPSARITGDTTFNYLYSNPGIGGLGRPVRNLQTISGGNGEAFKVAYVTSTSASGSSNRVYAVSRTNGAIARSYVPTGTLDYPLIYWDSTNTRYNLFFVQSGYRILALTDNGTTITANTAWASDGLKSFGNSTADPISEPIRIFDSDKQNYLYFFVTSYQNNTSTLYKVRASDGTVVTGGNYSAGAQSIGVNPGLARLAPPLYVDGTVYGFDKTPDFPYVFKIPSSGGATSWTNAFLDWAVDPRFPVWYTRNSLSSGPRLLVQMTTTVYRVDPSSMTGASEWGSGDEVGQSGVVGIFHCAGPVSPPFGSAPVPVFFGDAGGFGWPSRLYRASGSTGDADANFPYTLTGAISSGIAIQGSWLYFGTDKGYIYALSATDPTQSAGTRFRVPGDAAVVGVHVDATRSIVYFTTADGRVYQFDTR